MGKLFGTDGVRGVANEYPMTAEMALDIGRATAYLFKRKGHTPRIIVGKDTRISGYMLENALVSGICSMGVNALLVGPLPTPGIAFATNNMRADAGIAIFLKNTFPKEFTLEGTKIVLDCAHGATYRVAPETFSELGTDVKTIFDKPNGENINANCGSQHPETLAEEVVKSKAAVGFAFDGDGDRCITVDEKGSVLTGDQIMAICAKEMKKEGRLAHNLVVSTVMSNIGLGIALKELGIEYAFTRVGDRYVLEEMLAKGALLGGEDSGHVIFLKHHTTGDGIITALQVLAVMKKTQKPLSELSHVMKVFPQKLINVDIKTKPELSTIPEIREVIGEVEELLGDTGRVLVRYSGTQNLCRVMVEGPTDEETNHHCTNIAEVIREKLG
jgi:phosphoglucosamine mutase